MTPDAANAEAPYWVAFARALARRPPPLYSREDWEAEALLGLAVALRDLEPRGPRATHAPFLRQAIGRHLAKARRAVNSAATDGPPRVTYTRADRLQAIQRQPDIVAPLIDLTPHPTSPDPGRMLGEATLMDDLRAFGAGLVPTYRQAFGFLLRGLSPTEVASITGRTMQSEADRRMRVRRLLATHLEAA